MNKWIFSTSASHSGLLQSSWKVSTNPILRALLQSGLSFQFCRHSNPRAFPSLTPTSLPLASGLGSRSSAILLPSWFPKKTSLLCSFRVLPSHTPFPSNHGLLSLPLYQEATCCLTYAPPRLCTLHTF